MWSGRLEELEKLEITGLPAEELVDMRQVCIRDGLPAGQRMEEYLQEIKNPYCFLCGGRAVKITFDGGGRTLEDILSGYFTRLNQRDQRRGDSL